jgi:hypothetical protein
MKKAPESRTHEDVPDYIDGGRSGRETSVTEPTTPIKEESEATSMRFSIIISCAEKEGLQGGALVTIEGAQVPIPMSNIFL